MIMRQSQSKSSSPRAINTGSLSLPMIVDRMPKLSGLSDRISPEDTKPPPSRSGGCSLHLIGSAPDCGFQGPLGGGRQLARRLGRGAHPLQPCAAGAWPAWHAPRSATRGATPPARAELAGAVVRERLRAELGEVRVDLIGSTALHGRSFFADQKPYEVRAVHERTGRRGWGAQVGARAGRDRLLPDRARARDSPGGSAHERAMRRKLYEL